MAQAAKRLSCARTSRKSPLTLKLKPQALEVLKRREEYKAAHAALWKRRITTKETTGRGVRRIRGVACRVSRLPCDDC
jgi:hypothetical protein